MIAAAASAARNRTGVLPWLSMRKETATQRFAADALVGGIATLAAALVRMSLEPLVGGIAPFVLTFPAVMAATLLRGGMAGAITVLSCQLLTIRYVFPHWLSGHGGLSADLVNVILSTLTLAAMVWATAAYRAAALTVRRQCERQVDTLSLLVTEMDHRTKNNFQIAAGLLAHQAAFSLDLDVARELEAAGSRLETIAELYRNLGQQTAGSEDLNLADHLDRIVKLLRTGAVPTNVTVAFSGRRVVVASQNAIIVGLIVNEWVTNALKHAFVDRSGGIEVTMRHVGDAVEIAVADDGAGGGSASPVSHGTVLVRSLADVIGAEVTIVRDGGTTCRLLFRP